MGADASEGGCRILPGGGGTGGGGGRTGRLPPLEFVEDGTVGPDAMNSPVDLTRIVNRAVEDVEAAPAGDISLSEKLDRLAARHGEMAWPESVTTAMAELEAATRRAARLVARVSGAASSLGAVAADVAPPAAAPRDEPPSPDARHEPHGSGSSAKTV